MEEFGRRVLDDLWSGVLRDERYVSKEVWRQVLGTDPNTDPRYTEESQPVPDEFSQRIAAFARPAPLSPLDREAAEHEAFGRSRTGVYIGRQEYFDQLDAHAASDGPPLVVLGESGSGKSALVANWATRYDNRRLNASNIARGGRSW